MYSVCLRETRNSANNLQLRLRNLYPEPCRDRYRLECLPYRIRSICRFLHKPLGGSDGLQLGLWDDGHYAGVLLPVCSIIDVEGTRDQRVEGRRPA